MHVFQKLDSNMIVHTLTYDISTVVEYDAVLQSAQLAAEEATLAIQALGPPVAVKGRQIMRSQNPVVADMMSCLSKMDNG